ncbi:MAG: nucleotidyltransferase domain-containing protein [Syntrophorhabdaceae bacterium]|jgi:predicted nucleotidyltransferase|nr:nucleotidyltransferase domain-containing protein [Syntrophorhabdaceae bacterium]MDD5243536.1 nucleotidyltransferase domain-containing protein [Syntrophorhabdaceae bacterium]
MDIVKLFKSKARTALFQLYFTNPEGSYYLRELERMFNISVSILRKELMRLEEEGIFLSEKKGNLLYYRLNQTYPLFEELKNIVRKTIGVEGLLKDVMNDIKGVEIAFVYGSFAKGKAKAASDVDLCVIGRIDEDRLISKINAIEKSVKREINYTLFTPEEFKKRKKNKDGFILDLIDNKKIMLRGKENDLR